MCPLWLARVPSGIILFWDRESRAWGMGGKKAERKREGGGKWRGIGFCMGSWEALTPHPELFSYYLMCHSTAIYILMWTAVASLEDTLPTGWLSYGFWREGLHPRLHVTVLWDLYRSQWPGEPWTSTWESLGWAHRWFFFVVVVFKVLGLRQPRMRTTAFLLNGFIESLRSFWGLESFQLRSQSAIYHWTYWCMGFSSKETLQLTFSCVLSKLPIKVLIMDFVSWLCINTILFFLSHF